MKKSTNRRLTLSKETLRALEKDAYLEQVAGGVTGATEIRSCHTCTTACSLCTL